MPLRGRPKRSRPDAPSGPFKAREQLRRVLLTLLMLVLATAGCEGPTSAGSSLPRPGAAQGRAGNCTGPGADYPRTATYYLDPYRLPGVAKLARYDVVVLDSEWAHRVPRRFFRRLRAVDPGVCLFAYVNLVDRPDQLGSRGYWADRYSLWQFVDSTTSRFPRRWRATTAEGEPVSEYRRTTMANLTAHAPSVRGEIYAEYAARWVANTVWSTGLWDGIYLDVWGDRIYTADVDAWDSDRDGGDEPAAEIYGAGNPWALGLFRAERIMRHQMPKAVIVVNGDRTLRDERLDGRVWESFVDPKSGRVTKNDLEDYVTVTAGDGHRRPGVALTVNVRRAAPGSANDMRTARFRLASTLMQDGFWAPMGVHYGRLAYYRMLAPAKLGRGYLGRPLVKSPDWSALTSPFDRGVGSIRRGVFRRDFEHGIVLVNTTATRQRIELSKAYRNVHNGKVKTAVSLAPRDGVLLVRLGV